MLIDERGRVFGKINLIDALVVLVVLVLIPLGYATMRLFRTPPPTITAIEPAQATQNADVRLKIIGEHLRPFLNVRFGNEEVPGFSIQSPTLAEIAMPRLPPGTYDVALFDEAQELVRKAGALTIVPAVPSVASVAPPPPSAPAAPPALARVQLYAVGSLTGLRTEDANSITTGTRLPLGDGTTVDGRPATIDVVEIKPVEPWLRRLKLGPETFTSWQNPAQVRRDAIVRFTCAVMAVDDYCTLGTVSMQPGVSLELTLPRRAVPLTFIVQTLRPADWTPSFE